MQLYKHIPIMRGIVLLMEKEDDQSSPFVWCQAKLQMTIEFCPNVFEAMISFCLYRAIKAMRVLFKCTVLIVWGLGCYVVNATTWYVAANGGSDSNVGTSESSALLTIQKAVDKATAGDMINVAVGSYSYVVVPAVKEPLTIQAVGPINKCVINGVYPHRAVSIGNGMTTNVFVNGFTITGGNVEDSSNTYGFSSNGGGIAGGTANGCVIFGNRCCSTGTGGGAYKAVLNECIISNNTVGASYGWTGGIDNCVANRCRVVKNIGTVAGGASASVLTDCQICENKGYSSGVDGCTSYRCLIKDNISSDTSHSMYSWRATGINGGVAYNCIVVNNAGWKGAGLNGGAVYNCTFLNNSGAGSSIQGGKLYNCIIGRTSTGGNVINGATMFNCRIWNMSESGTTKTSCSAGDPGLSGYSPVFGSPCIDAGNNL